MQKEITLADNLLDERGRLKQAGWARRPLLAYQRRAVKAPSFRLKEWDYYCVLTPDFGLAATVADNGYLGFVAVTWFDFRIPREATRSVMVPFPLGKFGMPESSLSGDVVFHHPELSVEFRRHEAGRTLVVSSPEFGDGKALQARLELAQPADLESMVIATPFPRAPLSFYYNQKINNQSARGEVVFGADTFAFEPQSAFGVLDWGRGVWTYNNTWYWSSASGLVDGVPFGFNLGYGFGDTSAATENVLFYRGQVHKLDQVSFVIPEDSFLKPWTFTSNDGRFEMIFVPLLDRASNTNVLVIQSDQHQVFGRFTGTAVLDDGTRLQVKDFLGFAEKVVNRW
jgi:hypothetical protein